MRKKRIPTRRQRAIRKLILPALLLLLGVGSLLLHRGAVPADARRDSEDRSGIGPTTVLEELDIPVGEKLTVRGTLSENSRGLLFSVAHYDWLGGWQAVDEFTVDRNDQEALFGGAVVIGPSQDNGSVLIFGHADTEICRVEMEGEVFVRREWVHTPVKTVWERQGEETFFLFFPDWEKADTAGILRCVGYDAQGCEVARTEMYGYTASINPDGTRYGGYIP